MHVEPGTVWKRRYDPDKKVKVLQVDDANVTMQRQYGPWHTVTMERKSFKCGYVSEDAQEGEERMGVEAHPAEGEVWMRVNRKTHKAEGFVQIAKVFEDVADEASTVIVKQMTKDLKVKSNSHRPVSMRHVRRAYDLYASSVNEARERMFGAPVKEPASQGGMKAEEAELVARRMGDAFAEALLPPLQEMLEAITDLLIANIANVEERGKGEHDK